jgi:hypothetical protein
MVPTQAGGILGSYDTTASCSMTPIEARLHCSPGLGWALHRARFLAEGLKVDRFFAELVSLLVGALSTIFC